MATDGKLVFVHPSDGTGTLVLGDTGGAAATPDAEIRIHAGFAGDMRARIGLGVGAKLRIEARFAGDMAARIGLAWDANVQRQRLARRRGHWQPAQPIGAGLRTHSQPSQPIVAGRRSHWQPAQPLAAGTRAHAQASQPLRTAVRAAAQIGAPLLAGVRGHFQRSGTLSAGARLHQQPGLPIASAHRAAFEETIRLRASARLHAQPARALAMWVPAGLHVAARLDRAWRPHWQPARYPPPGISPPIVVVEPPREPCYDPATLGTLIFSDPHDGNGTLVFVCERAGTDPGQPPATVIVLRRRSYIVLTSLEVTRVDTGQVVPVVAGSFSMELDMQSFTWSFGFGTPGLARPLLMPGADGMPPELEVKVNGVPYRMHAESVERTVQHPRAMLAVSGRGLAAMLDAPYAATRSFAQPAPITAQQLMLDVLTINGVSIGWTLDWQLDDWHIPANSWAHHGSWIEAINDIAAAVGASVQPHDTAQVLRILPRYPVASWLLASATPDIQLPPGIASVERTEWPVKPAYDAIYMHGEPGVAVYHRTVPGSPGDVLAPMAVHPLLAHPDAARQRAIAELSDRGRQVLHELTLPLLPDTGLIKPGLLLRYTDDDDVTRTGIVRATRVADSSIARITQTIRVQAHEP